MTVSTAIDRAFLGALAPLDAPRNRFLRRFGRLLKPLIARRESRVVALGGNEAVFRLGGLAPPDSGLDVESLSRGLAPPWIDPDWTLRLLLLFAFAQAVHYAVWTRLIPDDARPRPGQRSFAGSYRALVADCGRPLVLVASLATVGLAALGPCSSRPWRVSPICAWRCFMVRWNWP